MPRPTTTAIARTQRPALRALLFSFLLIAVAACAADGGGSPDLDSLPLDGTPGASGLGAARTGTGHYFARVIDAGGTTVRLAPGAAQWTIYGTGYGAPSAPQYDGTMYATSATAGTLTQVSGAEYVNLLSLPAAGATFLGKTDDGRLHMLSSTFVGGTDWAYTFWSALPTDLTWRNDGSGTMAATLMWMTSKGRVFGWRRNVGLVQVAPATVTSTTLVACGQPGASAIDCANLDISAVPDRRGHFYFLSTVDVNGFEAELWRIPDGSSTASRVAGPRLPKLPESDGASNYYRPGVVVSLYADPAHRIWMAFRWGANNANDRGYLYRYGGSGWSFIRGDLSRLPILFGDGMNPGILGITLFGSMQVWTM